MPGNRKRKAEDNNEGDSRPSKKFASLQPRVQHVAQSAIQNKWTSLPDAAQEKVKELFRAAERPVLVNHRDERKRIEAQVAVASVLKNLGKRLPRMPFPPQTKEPTFDFEAILNNNRALEQQLNTTSDSIKLLKSSLDQEKRSLALDQLELERLENDCKAAEGLRKKHTKNAHAVVRALAHGSRHAPSSPAAKMANQENPTSVEFGTDRVLEPILSQLHDHLESMQNNVAPLSELSTVISRSKAALDLYSFQSLGPEKAGIVYQETG